ncbi:UvrD-helicase domain-containing protein [Peribacillus asahii]|uniref:nuclease-related domain-containing DEAD/DEAH box helicase n=1 Tax=Peribacillus asahii TaxID=228899 RepID=UPI00381F6B43
MLYIIPNDLPTLTAGERRVLEKIKALYSQVEQEAYLYVQPRLRNLEPDFILIDSQRGVSIIEVKDWGISYLENVNRRQVQLRDGKEVDNPIFKANQYYRSAEGLFYMEDRLLNDNGELNFKLYSLVIFANLKETDIQENELEKVFNQPPSRYIPSNRITSLTSNCLFNNEVDYWPIENITAIRTIIFPELKITNTNNEIGTKDIIKALDAEQERFAKRLPYGHYMVTGVPGSGKTILLLARAIHLIREHPEWNIRILTYNRSLQHKLESKINDLAADLAFMDVRVENITVTTFHRFALDIANVGVPNNVDNQWWTETLPDIAMKSVRPIHDAILVDEYQDFYESWIKLCIGACKIHTYTNNSKEVVEGINLFLAGDRLQSIYNTKEQSWKSIGIDMRGRSTLLKKAYRSGNEHIDLALNFLKQEKRLEEEVNNFYCAMNELSFENHVKDGVNFMEGSYTDMSNIIHHLVYKVGYEPKDILVLCKDWNSCYAMKACLDDNLQKKTEVKKNITGEKLVITTYYSSKGLEAPITILMDVHAFQPNGLVQKDIIERKLLYVGITRASEQLYIHANNYRNDSFAKVLRDLTVVPV